MQLYRKQEKTLFLRTPKTVMIKIDKTAEGTLEKIPLLLAEEVSRQGVN